MKPDLIMSGFKLHVIVAPMICTKAGPISPNFAARQLWDMRKIIESHGMVLHLSVAELYKFGSNGRVKLPGVGNVRKA